MPRGVAAESIAGMKPISRAAMGAIIIATAATIIPLAAPTSAIAAPAAAPTSLIGASTPQARNVSALSLPRPTGPFAVGRDTLHLVDLARTDPWVPQSGPRQLMVDIYYPTIAGTGVRAAYMKAAEAAALINYGGFSGALEPTMLADTRIRAHADAAPLPGRYPLVVLSPGFTVPRSTLTSLAEDLSSRGFVVAAVDHAYESVATQFPGGILPCAACDALNAGTISQAQIAASRVQDVSFLLTTWTIWSTRAARCPYRTLPGRSRSPPPTSARSSNANSTKSPSRYLTVPARPSLR